MEEREQEEQEGEGEEESYCRSQLSRDVGKYFDFQQYKCYFAGCHFLSCSHVCQFIFQAPAQLSICARIPLWALIGRVAVCVDEGPLLPLVELGVRPLDLRVWEQSWEADW